MHGETNADIAHRLLISPITVKTHINRIMTKVDVDDRTQLVIFAYQSGFTPRS